MYTSDIGHQRHQHQREKISTLVVQLSLRNLQKKAVGSCH